MSEATKRSVCNLLGCDYDKCQWRNDGYNGGGGGYSGGGYTDTIREYTVEVVKDERTEKYTEEESTEEYKPVEEYKPAEGYVKEEEEKVVTPGYISNKVEPEPTKNYGSTCSDVSFFSSLSLQLFAFISHIGLTIASSL